jgi:hypothetical protein
MDLPIPFDANGLETVSMALQNRMMTLVAFLQAQNCSNLPGSWRHPATMLDFLTPEYYQRIARTLEDGKIQMAFLDDRLALPDIYTGHRHAEAIGAGVRAVKLDPCTIMMAMGMGDAASGARDLLHDHRGRRFRPRGGRGDRGSRRCRSGRIRPSFHVASRPAVRAEAQAAAHPLRPATPSREATSVATPIFRPWNLPWRSRLEPKTSCSFSAR